MTDDLSGQGYNTDVVGQCIEEYKAHLSNLLHGKIFIEPYSWPETLDDVHGEFEFNEGNGWSKLSSSKLY